MTGNGQSPKALMYTDSRKAQRDRYAHHRADLTFSTRPARTGDGSPLQEGTESDLAARDRVRAGLIGFVSATATTNG